MITTYIPLARIRKMNRRQLIDTIANVMLERSETRSLDPQAERFLARVLIWIYTFFWPKRLLRYGLVELLRGHLE
jgi:hypothetical protein